MQYLIYLFIRLFGSLLVLLPYKPIHAIGRFTGSIAYFLHRSFRKKALSTLSIAYGSSMTIEERKKIALLSFQNLMITCLEFFRLKRSKNNLSEIVDLQDKFNISSLLEKKQGIIFLSAHQSNWEIPFLAVTSRFSGIAIGRAIKNKWLYRWILSVREMYGSPVVLPKNAIRQGLKALKQGKFLGIVGDQAFPESPYSYPLFGTRAWTATTPALLAYKTNCPLVVGTTTRVNGKYIVSTSKPIWPDLTRSMKEEVPAMMDKAMGILETSIKRRPEEWMWIHDRFKQHGINFVKRSYRHAFILVILPKSDPSFIKAAELIRKIYPRNFLTFFIPEHSTFTMEGCTIVEYSKEEDLLVEDYRYGLVLDFLGSKKARRHFKKLGAFVALFFENTDPELIKKTLLKPQCLTTVSI